MVTKKIVICALLIVISAIGKKTFAHSRLSKEDKVKHITEKMTKKLLLTEEQKAKVFQINLERANQQEETYKHVRKEEVIQNVVDNWKKKLKQVLTTEQVQKFKSL